MKFRIYTFTVKGSWELYKIVYREEQVEKILNRLSNDEYTRYIIIKELKDQDEICDIGNIENKTKKYRKKK